MYRLTICVETDEGQEEPGVLFQCNANSEDGRVVIDVLSATTQLMHTHLSTEARD